MLFNDPFDNQFDLHVDTDPKEVRALALSKLWTDFCSVAPVKPGNIAGHSIQLLKSSGIQMTRDQFEREFGPTIDTGIEQGLRYLPEFHRQVRELARQHKILCLSTGIDSTLMWSYYSENHQGLALSFRSAEGCDSPWRMGRPVTYSKQMPRLFSAETQSDVHSGRSNIGIQNALDQLIFTKSSDWSHEKEWRIFAGAGRKRNQDFEDIRFNPLEIDSVIIGCKMPDSDRAEVVELVRTMYPHARLRQMMTLDRDYGLRVVPIDVK